MLAVEGYLLFVTYISVFILWLTLIFCPFSVSLLAAWPQQEFGKLFVSPAVERGVYKLLIGSIQKLLSVFKTSLAEDNRLLKRRGLSLNTRHAILARKGEKEVRLCSIVTLSSVQV